ncbi:beta-lactamase class A [Anseongella ginsenosidimutans]|uniref:beta-lactamase n=1 Tax=Anseongella ginsenosidimutans TaxID=496056 RepID=A0A4R3KNA2_9SPHI|nr:serine hydrolase [Anseongella ginsenosidimutans]QEC52055.1 serine hydrolase [Anseongella ginsenosidimutans]TCS85634.1 beta-lactamase class A [Anseongella ginsenosidimutans]
MLKYLLAVLITSLTATGPRCQSITDPGELRERIISRLEAENGTFAVAFHDMDTGKELLFNEREVFHAASTMKTPVLIEIYKQAAEGKLSLDDSLLIKNKFKSIVDGSLYRLDAGSDSDTTLYKRIGEQVPLKKLLYKMIIRSSNLATNIIIELAGAENVTKTMRNLGAADIRVLRGVEDLKAYEKGLSNTTTAFDLLRIYQKMASGEIVSPEASKAMISTLLDQEFDRIIPAGLPEDVKVAHKTGSISGVRHDSGIVFLPGGRTYVLVLLSKDLEDAEAGIAAMADVSEMIYRYMAAQ